MESSYTQDIILMLENLRKTPENLILHDSILWIGEGNSIEINLQFLMLNENEKY